MQFSNPSKTLKRIDYDMMIRRLPQPETKEDRMDNIYNTTIEPIYIQMLSIPANGEIILHLDDDEDIIDIETDTRPNVFFRKGGLMKPREEEEPIEARTRPRWN